MMLVGPVEIKPRECVEATSADGDATRVVGRLKLNRLQPVHGYSCACFNGVILAGVLVSGTSRSADADDS